MMQEMVVVVVIVMAVMVVMVVVRVTTASRRSGGRRRWRAPLGRIHRPGTAAVSVGCQQNFASAVSASRRRTAHWRITSHNARWRSRPTGHGISTLVSAPSASSSILPDGYNLTTKTKDKLWIRTWQFWWRKILFGILMTTHLPVSCRYWGTFQIDKPDIFYVWRWWRDKMLLEGRRSSSCFGRCA